MNQRKQPLAIVWAIVGGFGGLTVLSSAALMLLALLTSAPGSEALRSILWASSLLFFLMGTGLLWSGVTGWRQTPSPRFYGWGLLLAFGILTLLAFALGTGLAILAYGSLPFSIMHAVAILGPALFWMAVVSLAAGPRFTLTLRQMFVAMTGSVASILLAFTVEIFGLLSSLAAVVMVAYGFPGGKAEITRLIHMIEQWAIVPPQPEELLTLLASPVVLGLLVLLLAIIAPLIEELGKILIAGVMGWIAAPGLTRAFVWGAACGIGFAIVEGVANGLSGGTDVTSWVFGASSRIMATAMHALVSGIVGLGLGLAWRKRWWALPLSYFAAVGIHGLWNLSVVLLMGGAALIATSEMIGLIGMVLGMGIIGCLILLTPVSLIGIPLALRRYEERATVPTHYSQEAV